MTGFEDIKVVDIDSHVAEPIDLWTSRLPGKFADVAPRVEPHPDTGLSKWRVGDYWLTSEAFFAVAGWPEYSPACPPSLAEADPASHDANQRLARLDEHGVWAQVLYPNLIGFDSWAFMQLGHDAATACVQAYNDFLVDWASADPARLVPIMMLPFWDVAASVEEMGRAHDLGHKGILWANQYEKVGLPGFIDPHWNPVYAEAQERNLSINFHIGFSAVTEAEITLREQMSSGVDPIVFGMGSALAMLSNTQCIAQICMMGLCERFPALNFVSVESGFGYLPFLLDAMDWQWHNAGCAAAYPDRLLPSEYFRRQVYGSFWFEKTSLPLLEQLADNVMFETDFPHPTSLSPGPASSAQNARGTIQANMADIPLDVVQKVLHTNAARLYNLD